MSVYTPVSRSKLDELLKLYRLGEVLEFTGIEAGIENTNYKLVTNQGRYVLTLFEHHNKEEVADFIHLALHLGEHNLNVPAPLLDEQGQGLHELVGKPAIVCPFLSGEHIQQPNDADCYAIGEAMAEFHLVAQRLPCTREDIRHFSWWQSEGERLIASLNQASQDVFRQEIVHQSKHQKAVKTLPSGWIHGDMFHDNALMIKDGQATKVSAILDLYNGCEGAFMYDLAIIANDWCVDHNDDFIPDNLKALMAGYQHLRKLEPKEIELWPTLLQAAALRFWLSRLLTQEHQQQHPNANAITKDPSVFERKLIKRQQNTTDNAELIRACLQPAF